MATHVLATTADGDLDVSTGNLAIVSDTRDVALIWLRKEFKLILGSWFLDQSKGFPWLTEILGKKPRDLRAINALFRGVCMRCPEAVDATVDTAFDGATRGLSVSFEVKLSDGTTAADTVGVQ